MSEATVYRIVRWVEDYLLQCGQFHLAGKKQLVRGFGRPQVVVMDVTQTPPQRVPAVVNVISIRVKKDDTLSSARL